MRRRSPKRVESEVVRLARRIAARPCNRNGTDKTWVVELHETLEEFFTHARPVRAKNRR